MGKPNEGGPAPKKRANPGQSHRESARRRIAEAAPTAEDTAKANQIVLSMGEEDEPEIGTSSTSGARGKAGKSTFVIVCQVCGKNNKDLEPGLFGKKPAFALSNLRLQLC